MKAEKLVTSALPTIYGPFTVHAYASAHDGFPHLALVHGDIDWTSPIPVRIHSECMTGDVFGSLRCDCGEQLASSMQYLEDHGGILVYLRQEGRGIGLTNKLKAYNLQDGGLDTIKANHALGFHTDERHYGDAVDILLDLGVKQILILTNNPDKVDAFADTGIAVSGRIPVLVEARPENRQYLQTKKNALGHLL